MRLKPLKQWICDKCGEVIEGVEQGWLEWLVSKDRPLRNFGFRIVHQGEYSPRKPQGTCYFYDHWHGPELYASSNLDDFAGDNAIPALLWFIDRGPLLDKDKAGPMLRDEREWAELVRRLTIPYYEEARFYLRDAYNDGELEGLDANVLYHPNTLKWIVKRHRGHS